MKVELRIYSKNPSSSRAVTLEECDILTAFKAFLTYERQIDTNNACEIEVEEITMP